ncbi:unnamed protein product [Ceutorhynchus assimilis]|uniref:Uncharacterized protein n=1 Tax=Ceutorhynchus assimilis TaxID=467358 RepID=A0A9N9MXD6_9CUCU|nr:unnamed protein product [Ceutorhynchus assimilis]
MDCEPSTSASEETKANTKRRESKRESIFETRGEEKESYLEEWDRIWGHHNTDYVNVVQYPKHCIKQLEEEFKNTTEACDTMAKKYEEFESRADQVTLIEDCPMSPGKKVILQDMDSRITELLKQWGKAFQSLELDEYMRQNQLKEFEREAKLRKAMLVQFMRNKFNPKWRWPVDKRWPVRIVPRQSCKYLFWY